MTLSTLAGITMREVTQADFAQTRAHVLRVVEEDLRLEYRPEWHWDLDDMQRVYVDHPRQALFVALDSGDVVGTTSVVNVGPNTPPHPAWVAERYNGPGVAQLLRVYIDRAHRRRGIARALVDHARKFVAADGGYDTIYLHTDASVPGAEAFWRAMPTRLVYDGRGNTQGYSQAVHFELALPVSRQVER
jgi:ribosomal protein S18 acetylase RimI-like enzyme